MKMKTVYTLVMFFLDKEEHIKSNGWNEVSFIELESKKKQWTNMCRPGRL